MTEVVLAAAWFAVAALTDYLSIEWQEAREARAAARCATIAVVLEAITWGAVLLAVAGYWLVVAAALAGSWVGSYVGVKRAGRQD